MSKLSSEVVEDSIKNLLRIAKNGDGPKDKKSKNKVQGRVHKKRNFVESIELQNTLKNYDPNKDKRFSGVLILPVVPRPKFSVCVIGNQQDMDEAKTFGIPFMSQDDLTKLKKDKKKVKSLAAGFNAFLASSTLIRNIPRLLGPGLNKAGKFPAVLNPKDNIKAKVEEARATVKFQLKAKKSLCLCLAVANVGMTQEEIINNVTMSINFMASLLPKNWGQIKKLYIKSTMGPSFQVYGF